MTDQSIASDLAKRTRDLAETGILGHWSNSKDGELLFEVSEFLGRVARERNLVVEPIPSTFLLSFGS